MTPGGFVYLDWNATTPLHPAVLGAMESAREQAWANPASVHAAGRAARRRQEDARERLAGALGWSPRDVVFTSGGTEANHLALSGATSLFLSRLEHASLVGMAEFLGERGVRVHFLPATPEGLLDLDAFADTLGRAKEAGSLGERPLLVLQAANQETGVIQPLEAAVELARREGLLVHVDAVQVLGRAPLGAITLADTVAVSSHKVRGPKGVGALATVCGYQVRPLGRGGAQERGLRAGTLDGVALAGFDAALARLEESVAAYGALGALRDALETELCRRGMAQIHGANVSRLAHVSNFALPEFRGDELVAALDLQGICVSSGSACSAGSSEPSAVVTAMLGREAAARAVRVSFGEGSTREDLDRLLGALARVGALGASGAVGR